MKTAGAAALLLMLAACEDMPPEATAEELRVEDAFHLWIGALLRGGVDLQDTRRASTPAAAPATMHRWSSPGGRCCVPSAPPG